MTFAIQNQQLRLTAGNDWGYLIWTKNYFGPEQEVYFHLNQVGGIYESIELFLKAQANLGGMIDVWYDPGSQTVEVNTYDSVNGWQTQGSASLSLAAGDQFGAAATENGAVMVYKNTQLVLTANVTSWPQYRNGGFVGLGVSPGIRLDDFGGGNSSTATFPAFPEYGLLDNFNRADGAVGGSWGGQTSEFRIYNQQLKLRYADHWAYLLWNTLQDVNQEAYDTLADIDESTSSIDLFLKAQSLSGSDIPMIDVWYDPSAELLEVCTFDAGEGWDCGDQYAPVGFMDGDVFGAVATEDGQVWVFKNTELVLKVDRSAWAYAGEDGYVGLGGYEGLFVDDFGGGSSGQRLSFQQQMEDFTVAVVNWLDGVVQGQKPEEGPGIDISSRPTHTDQAKGAGNAIWEAWAAWKKARKSSKPANPAPIQTETPTLEPTLTKGPISPPEQDQGETLPPKPLEESASSGYSARPHWRQPLPRTRSPCRKRWRISSKTSLQKSELSGTLAVTRKPWRGYQIRPSGWRRRTTRRSSARLPTTSIHTTKSSSPTRWL